MVYDVKPIRLKENFHRKERRDLEKAYGILKRYEDYGYSGQQAIQGVKTRYNQISKLKISNSLGYCRDQ